ncbi:MAG TPA: Tat pathway signal protein [Caulobacteraceae bacterium]|nr:Tat pathway signal protein [Caulobacteraceae bacterium]
MNRRQLALIALAAAVAPSVAAAQQQEQKKKGGGLSYIQFATITATVIKSNGRRGVLTVDAGVDVPNAALRAKVNLIEPRLRAAYVQLLQSYVYSLSPGAPPDADFLSMTLQRETDRMLGQPGARVLLGAMLVN